MFKNFLYITLLSLFLVSCTGTSDNQLLLSADFESDSPGSSPNFNLPGDPDGDLLDWNDDNSGSLLPVSVVTKPGVDDNPDSQRLRLVSVASNAFSRLTFIPNRTGDAGNVFVIQWEGELEAQPVSGTSVVLSVITGPSAHTSPSDFSLVLKPRGGATDDFKIDVFLGNDNGEPDEKIGELQNDQLHSFTITVDVDESTYTIIGGNVGSVRTGTRSFSSGASSSQAPILQLRFTELGGVTNYYFEDVSINQIR